jgi:hypothetical protein
MRIYLTLPAWPEFVLHFKMSQTTILVKKVDMEYTSASTALNQWESVKAKVSAPIIALP